MAELVGDLIGRVNALGADDDAELAFKTYFLQEGINNTEYEIATTKIYEMAHHMTFANMGKAAEEQSVDRLVDAHDTPLKAGIQLAYLLGVLVGKGKTRD